MKKVNTMIKEFSRKYAVLFALLVSVLYISFFLGIGTILGVIAVKLSYDYYYTFFLIQEIIGTAAAFFILKLSGLFDILKNKGTGIFKGFITGGFFIFGSIMCLYEQLPYLCKSGLTLRSPFSIAMFVLTMIFIGASEEIISRGVITTMLYKKFGGTNSGIWKTVVISGLLFGIMHFTNMFATMNPIGVLIQVAGVSVIGMVFSAIYLRNGTIWVNVVLHAFNDIAAGIPCIYIGQRPQNIIDDYKPIKLLGIILYAIMLLVLLRKNKIETIPANFAQLFAEPAENASFVKASPVEATPVHE